MKFTTASAIAILVASVPLAAGAQSAPAGAVTAAGTNRPLQLSADSPFRDPDIIYLEADQLINESGENVLIAEGNVEGRYQDRTLRADRVTYNNETGQVIAIGDVVLIDPTGATQFADQIELSGELEAGSATNFTARFEEGGILGASFVVRDSQEGVELYNAYYTACEPCRDDAAEGKDPTWQIKARKVKQNPDRNSIEYRDAIFQLAGVPVFYTPFLSHPDPSAKRASGLLAPFGGITGDKGLGIEIPYYWAIDKYTEATLTPHIYSKVNPLLKVDLRRKFYSGEVNINGSITYGSAFDNNGDPFDDPTRFTNQDEATTGRRLRSHVFADGIFSLTDDWTTGFGLQAASDDLYLRRYDLNQFPSESGLYQSAGNRLISQAFALGQTDNTRFSISTFGFQSLRTSITRSSADSTMFNVFREDDSILPIALPKVELNHFVTDPVIGGRAELFGDLTLLSRKNGEDYLRGTGGISYDKRWIAPGGLEVKPFGELRYDYIELETEDGQSRDFSRNLGQVGVDIRYPFIKHAAGSNIVIEPRVQVTQSFGDGELGNFSEIIGDASSTQLFQDSIGLDFDRANFFASNKSLGYDFWQEGLRADVGASVSADWGKSRASLFLGQSYASDFDDSFARNSGLEGDKSDIVGEAEYAFSNKFSLKSRVRFDDDDGEFRTIDTSLRYTGDRIKTNWRYYRINTASPSNSSATLTVPAEEISGNITVKLAKNWSTRYSTYYDIDADTARRQELGLIYDDQCTRIELFYNQTRNNIGVVGDNEGFGIRLSLLTLGEFAKSSNNRDRY
jgi:LPS-assembly protein